MAYHGGPASQWRIEALGVASLAKTGGATGGICGVAGVMAGISNIGK